MGKNAVLTCQKCGETLEVKTGAKATLAHQVSGCMGVEWSTEQGGLGIRSTVKGQRFRAIEPGEVFTTELGTHYILKFKGGMEEDETPIEVPWPTTTDNLPEFEKFTKPQAIKFAEVHELAIETDNKKSEVLEDVIKAYEEKINKSE